MNLYIPSSRHYCDLYGPLLPGCFDLQYQTAIGVPGSFWYLPRHLNHLSTKANNHSMGPFLLNPAKQSLRLLPGSQEADYWSFRRRLKSKVLLNRITVSRIFSYTDFTRRNSKKYRCGNLSFRCLHFVTF